MCSKIQCNLPSIDGKYAGRPSTSNASTSKGLYMAKTLNKLSPLTIKGLVSTSKKEGRAIKTPDGGGLYFVAEPERSSWWRFDYRINGKQKTLSVGLYPEISLPEARARRGELREQVANTIDPSQQRKAERASQSGADSFEPIAREWWEYKRESWTEGHARRTLTRLVNLSSG